MPYDIKTFRCVKHSEKEVTAYCRHCRFSLDSVKDKNVVQKAREHALNTGHTVDVYRQSWIEYTCHKRA